MLLLGPPVEYSYSINFLKKEIIKLWNMILLNIIISFFKKFGGPWSPQPLPLRRPCKLSSWRFSSWFLMPTKKFIRLRLVFTSDGVVVGIVGGVVGALFTLWQSKIGVMSWTASWARRNRSQNGIRTFPSGPYALVSIFFWLSLWLRRFVVGVVVVSTLCDWFGSSAWASDSDNLVFTWS